MRPASILKPGAVLALSLAACVLAAPAQASTSVAVGGDAALSGGASFYVVNFDFNLPTDFVGAQLHITHFYADDRGILRLNGADVDSAGLFGPGDGTFDFGAGAVPYTFGVTGAHDVLVGSGFVAGLNTLRLIMNDTGTGMVGSLVNGPNGPSGTTGYNLVAELTYDVRPGTPGAIPEPGAWALMILGFGGVGATMRGRGRRPAIA
jgi:hypothetical protein